MFFSCQTPKKFYDKQLANTPFDAIIVPGVPFDSTWSRTMKGRVVWSYHLYQSGMTKNIIYSGSAVYTPYIEAKIMAEYAKALGIPEDVIIIEPNAEHSTENLTYSLAIADQMGFNNVALATDPYQNAMLRIFARQKHMRVHFIPFIIDTLRTYGNVDIQIDPSVARVDDFVALPDRLSWFRRMMGTMGYRINEELAPVGFN